MIKNFLSSIVVSLFLILLVILCSENDKEESRHEPQNTWFYMPTQKEVEYEGYFYPYSYRDIWQDISLHIKELKSFQNGSLYALELDQLNVTDPFDSRWGENIWDITMLRLRIFIICRQTPVGIRRRKMRS